MSISARCRAATLRREQEDICRDARCHQVVEQHDARPPAQCEWHEDEDGDAETVFRVQPGTKRLRGVRRQIRRDIWPALPVARQRIRWVEPEPVPRREVVCLINVVVMEHRVGGHQVKRFVARHRIEARRDARNAGSEEEKGDGENRQRDLEIGGRCEAETEARVRFGTGKCCHCATLRASTVS